jgi:drug/metabolite transporter (DMT)-like permease
MATFFLTALAMLAFAANSILCRLALQAELIDAASFTAIRTVSGAAMLILIVVLRQGWKRPRSSDWWSALMLFSYMGCFSYAYISLSAGTGALILFGSVQVTMILHGIVKGESLTGWFWTGFALAVTGLVWLVSPGLAAPDPFGAVLMCGAGLAWGIYSLLGRQNLNASFGTAQNFVLATPMALLLSLLTLSSATISAPGATLAVASGALTSGLGYIVWYTVLPRLTSARAASVQLTVPVIATILGVIALSETVSTRLVLASIAILGGVGIIVGQRAATDARTDNRERPA